MAHKHDENQQLLRASLVKEKKVAYVRGNPKTKKELRAWIESGRELTVYIPGGMFPTKENGVEYIDGPHGVHKWHAQVQMKDGFIEKLIS